MYKMVSILKDTKPILLAEGGSSKIYTYGSDHVKKVIFCQDLEAGFNSFFELEILHNYRHPHLIHAEGCQYTDRRIEIIMPRAIIDLQETCENNQLKIGHNDLIRFFYQVSLAVAELHRNNILHLDIKPENILIFKEGESLVAKLADFGHTKYLPNGPVEYNVCGTPLFIAPEGYSSGLVNNGKMELYPELDIWSLGLTFFLLFSGINNFTLHQSGEELSLNQLFNKIKTWFGTERKQYIDRYISNPMLNSLLFRMLDQSKQRPTINQVVDTLEQYLEIKDIRPILHLPIYPTDVITPKPLINDYFKFILASDKKRDYVIQTLSYLYAKIEENIIKNELYDLAILRISLTYHGLQTLPHGYLSLCEDSYTEEDLERAEGDIINALYKSNI